MSAPVSPVDMQEMRLKMTVPVDWRRPNEGKSYDMYWSDSSQYGQLYPRPTEAEIASFYQVQDYYTHGNNVAPKSKQAKQPRFFAWLLRRLSWQIDKSVYISADWFHQHTSTQPQRILDLGCGDGALLVKMRDAGHTVFGIEPDPDARKVALAQGLNVVDGTGENLPEEIKSQKFDAVFMTHVLEHALHPIQVIENVFELLNDGGRFIIEVPNNAAQGLEEAGVLWHWLDVPRHLNFFTPESLRNMCKMAGFGIQATEFRGYTRQFDQEWREVEQKIYDRYIKYGVSPSELPERNSLRQSWQLLRKTYFANDETKYDSVRVIAVKDA